MTQLLAIRTVVAEPATTIGQAHKSKVAGNRVEYKMVLKGVAPSRRRVADYQSILHDAQVQQAARSVSGSGWFRSMIDLLQQDPPVVLVAGITIGQQVCAYQGGAKIAGSPGLPLFSSHFVV